MDLAFQLFKVIISSLKLLLIKLFNFRAIKFHCMIKTSNCPSIRVRQGGGIELGDVKFRKDNKLFADGGHIYIGDKSFFNNGCSITSKGSVHIGSNCLFGEGIKIYDHNHKLNGYVASQHEFVIKNVMIGDNCWLGSNCVILPGVTICDSVIIGAGSVVVKSITEPGVYTTNNAILRKIK